MSSEVEVTAPIARLLADPLSCHRFSEDVAVHWFPDPLASACWCGELMRQEEAWNAEPSFEEEED